MSRTMHAAKSRYKDVRLPVVIRTDALNPCGTTDEEREHCKPGHIHGIKISACRACGHVRQVVSSTGLCGHGACLATRQRRFDIRKERRRGQAWRDGQKATT